MQEVNTKSVPTQRRVALPVSLARTILWTAVSLLFLWLLAKLIVYGMAFRSLRQHQQEVEQLLSGGITQIDGEQLEAIVLGVRGDLLTIEEETAVFYPLLTRMGWVPKYGPTLTITPQLLDMANSGTEMAAFAIRGIKPAFAILQDDALTQDEQMAALLQVVDQAEADLIQADLSLQKISDTYATIPQTTYEPALLNELLLMADRMLPMAQDGMMLLPILPEMAGVDGPKRYLVLAQNENELRASGGFISGAGVLTVENGRLVSFDFEDAYQVDDFSKPYGDPPTGLAEVMGFELFLFRDANYWPDFPTSAEQTMALYSYGREGTQLDGAIAFNQAFLENLLEITGPVTVPASNVTLTSGNVKQALQNAWEASSGERWQGDRKDFLGVFAQALQDKLLNDVTALDPMLAVQEITEAAESKNLQIYMKDPAAAAVFNRLDWDGRMENPTLGDYLFVVDSNVGFNKTNLFINRQLAYDVTITPNLDTTSTLAISYFHEGQTAPDCTQRDILVPIQPTFAEISNQCYWNYVRIYTPANTVLTTASTHPISGERLLSKEAWPGVFDEVPDLQNFTVFDNLLMIEQGQSDTYTLQFQSSGLVHQIGDGLYQYTLQLGQQSGLKSETVRVVVTLPQGATISSVLPEPTKLTNNQIVFEEVSESPIVVQFEQ